jgi:hypothetical protein
MKMGKIHLDIVVDIQVRRGVLCMSIHTCFGSRPRDQDATLAELFLMLPDDGLLDSAVVG